MDRLMDTGIVDPVIVFEKQIRFIIYLRQIVDQARQNRRGVDQVVLEDQLNSVGTHVRPCVVQGLRYVK
jgi:hypothetical protein